MKKQLLLNIILLFFFFEGFSQTCFVTFNVGSCGTCLRYFYFLNKLPIETDLKFVVSQKYEPMGRKVVDEYVKIEHSFDVIFSDSLYNTYQQSDYPFTFVETDLEGNILELFGIDKIYEKIYKYIPPREVPKTVLFKIPDSILFVNGRLFIDEEKLIAFNEDNIFFINRATQQYSYFHNLQINTQAIYNDAFSDTIQYHYLMKDRNSPVSIMRKERIIFNSLLKNNGKYYVLSQLPEYTIIGNSYRVGAKYAILEIQENKLFYKDFINKYFPEKWAMPLDNKSSFILNNNLYIPIFSLDSNNKFLPQSPYSCIQIKNEKFTSVSLLENFYDISDLETDAKFFDAFLYSNNFIFNKYGNEVYDIENKQSFQLSTTDNNGFIIAANNENGKISLVYEYNEEYIYVVFEKKDGTYQPTKQEKIMLNIDEINSEIIFKASNSLLYVNFRNEIIEVAL